MNEAEGKERDVNTDEEAIHPEVLRMIHVAGEKLKGKVGKDITLQTKVGRLNVSGHNVDDVVATVLAIIHQKEVGTEAEYHEEVVHPSNAAGSIIDAGVVQFQTLQFEGLDHLLDKNEKSRLKLGINLLKQSNRVK